MQRILNLRTLFTAVAMLEMMYCLLALFTPPSLVTDVTGWVLNPDGHWIVKLMGVALGTQAWVAWAMRRTPHLAVAKALSAYQLGSATVDWVMWLAMADEGIFSTPLARVTVLAAIVSHYALGLLLVLGIARASRAAGN